MAQETEREELALLFDVSLDLLCVAGTDGYFRDVNPAFSQTLGWSREELLSKPFFDYIHADDHESTAAALRSLSEGKEVVDFENRFLCKEGTLCWLQWRAAPREGSELVYAVARDITRHKKMAEQLRQSEARYRVLVENANDIIYETDTEGHFRFFNAVAPQITGYSEDELRGMHFLKLIHPDYREDAREFYASQWRQKTPSTYFEFPMMAKDGNVVWLGQHVKMLSTGDGRKTFHAVARDITERKRFEDTLAGREATILALLDSASQAVVAVDGDGSIVFTNPMAEVMFGYREEELLHLTIETLMPERYRGEHVAHRRGYFAKPHCRPMGIGLDLTARRKDGKEFPVEASLNYFERGDRMLAVGFISDISQRKQMEKEVRDREKFRVLADGLLQGQEEERRRIARELHDNVNQKLAMLAVELGILAGETREDRDGPHGELDRLRQHAVSLSEEVRQISHGLHPAELEHFGLVSALRSLAKQISELEDISVELVARCEPESFSPEVSVGLYRFAQEALRNAVKHSGAVEVNLLLEGVEGGVKLSVVDRGIGFDVEQAKGKAGLGLVSMEERIRLLGGRLLIKSTPGKGTGLEAFVPAGEEEP